MASAPQELCAGIADDPKPSSARLVFSDVIVNNNKSTNSRRDDRPPAEKARHDAYGRAQLASFNLTNAPICVVGSSKAFVTATARADAGRAGVVRV
jgi:hypothetical protein